MVDYRKLTVAFFKGWMMAFGLVMAIYAAFVAVWLKCTKFRNWFTGLFMKATLETMDDQYESFDEKLKAL